MIYEIYKKIKKRLRKMAGTPVRHVGLWNRNIEFAEEENWERPAVFIEFEAVKWECVDPGYEYHATPRIVLHIVTDWYDTEEPEEPEPIPVEFGLPERIHGALCGLSGDCFCDLDLEESHTNHDHDELLESIEIYSCDSSRILEEAPGDKQDSGDEG